MTLVIRSDIRERFLNYCEENGILKGMLAERLFDSFLKGETFTPAEVGALKGSEFEEESRPPSIKNSEKGEKVSAL